MDHIIWSLRDIGAQLKMEEPVMRQLLRLRTFYVHPLMVFNVQRIAHNGNNSNKQRKLLQPRQQQLQGDPFQPPSNEKNKSVRK